MLQKVVDYQLLTSNQPEELTSKVKQAMGDDWVPSGTVVDHEGLLVQAMVKFG